MTASDDSGQRPKNPTDSVGENTLSGPIAGPTTALPELLQEESGLTTWADATDRFRDAVRTDRVDTFGNEWCRRVRADLEQWGARINAWAETTVLLTLWPDADVPPVDRVESAASAHSEHLWDCDGVVADSLEAIVGGTRWSGQTVVAPGRPNPHLHVGLTIADQIDRDAVANLADDVVGDSLVLPDGDHDGNHCSVRSGRADGRRLAGYLAENVVPGIRANGDRVGLASARTGVDAGATAIFGSSVPPVFGAKSG